MTWTYTPNQQSTEDPWDKAIRTPGHNPIGDVDSRLAGTRQCGSSTE